MNVWRVKDTILKKHNQFGGTGSTKPPLTMEKTTRKKYYFLQDWGTYKNDTLVVVGHTFKEIKKIIKHYNNSDEFIKFLETTDFQETMWSGGANGLVAEHKGKTILWLKDWSDEWEKYETLMHELHHLVYMVLIKNRAMDSEMEAQAYQQEYLFRNIRQKLYKFYTPKKSKKK